MCLDKISEEFAMDQWDRKRSVMQRYDLTAHLYDMRYAEEQTAKIEAAMKNINLEKHNSVLDVGCGTGLLFGYVANRARMVVGLDISRKILCEARERAKRFPNVHLICADADNIPLKENVFDYAFAVTLIQNMPNPLRTLNEIRRVTRKNAVVVTTGLKMKFSLEAFEELLRNAGLDILALENENLKCHVAVCTRLLH
jgi:malonyl-CoA O-methyltransferase